MSDKSSSSVNSSAPLSSQQKWLDAWYGARRWTLCLLPLMAVFMLLSGLRRWWLCRHHQVRLHTPVIVVGNISLGGTGKTPLLIALVKHFQQQGYQPGVISRGYGGKAPVYPYLLEQTSTAAEAGDEPISIYRQTGCAVCVGPDRVAAARLLEDKGCDLLLSDDGLQHYRLGRDIEIAVVDGQRGLGNGYCLPVGPLRETAERLMEVDWVVVNSPAANFALPLDEPLYTIAMDMQPQHWVRLVDGECLPATHLQGQQVHALAGIGNPQRFYRSLQQLGVSITPHDFPDHHHYRATDLQFTPPLPLVMTEKDAVKCQAFAQPDWYYLAVQAHLPEVFWQALDGKLQRVIEHKISAFNF